MGNLGVSEAKGVRVLVIDDEKSVCISCKRILEDEGHKVDYETSAVLGMKRAIEEEFEVVLLDLKMPELSGIEVLEMLRQECPDLTVIIITGYATIQTSIEAVKKGAYNYVPKPFTPDELAMVVKKAQEDKLVREENIYLKSELDRLTIPMTFLGRSMVIEDIQRQILKVAPTNFTICIHGESGTGKELIARAIHEHSDRAAMPFVAVDISALAPTLIESELFGHVRGAFTGATETRPGYFAVADKGTLFLDEIANASFELQGKLLRALDSGRIRRVGEKSEQEVDVRIISATNRSLMDMVERGEFREDLYYRLNVIPVNVPPLRERAEDIPLLAMHFLERALNSTASRVKGFSTEAMAKLVAYAWPGNVRQLINMVERLVATTDDELVRTEHLPEEINGALPSSFGFDIDKAPSTAEELKQAKQVLKDMVYERIERAFIIEALSKSGGIVAHAAEQVGMQRPNFHAMMRKHGIKGRDF